MFVTNLAPKYQNSKILRILQSRKENVIIIRHFFRKLKNKVYNIKGLQGGWCSFVSCRPLEEEVLFGSLFFPCVLIKVCIISEYFCS